MHMRGMSALRRKVARGEYVIDEQAVAEAIIRRRRERAISRVLVSPEAVHDLSAGSEEHGSAPGRDLA
jgi:hypothetical protein